MGHVVIYVCCYLRAGRASALMATELLAKLKAATAVFNEHSGSSDKSHAERFVQLICEADKIAKDHMDELVKLSEENGFAWENTFFHEVVKRQRVTGGAPMRKYKVYWAFNCRRAMTELEEDVAHAGVDSDCAWVEQVCEFALKTPFQSLIDRHYICIGDIVWDFVEQLEQVVEDTTT